MLPGINPDNASFHVVHSESVGPPTTAGLPVDGASAFTAHRCCLNSGQTCIPVSPKQDTGDRKWSMWGGILQMCTASSHENWLMKETVGWIYPSKFGIHPYMVLTHLEGLGRWLGDAPLRRLAGSFSWSHPVWPPQSGPDCSPPSKCFLLSSPQLGLLE